MQLALSLPAFVCLSAPALAQCDPAGVLPSDGGANQGFGYAVAVSGAHAVIGAYGDSDGGPFSGAAYVFTTSGSEVVKLGATNAMGGDLFGFSVDVHGTRAVVGALNSDGAGSNSGSAYLFDVPSGVELLELTASDADAGDLFGASVGIGATYAACGAWADEEDGEESGAVYVFDVATGTEVHELSPSNAAAFRRFGTSVAVDAGVVLVGAPSDGTLAGAAYLFDAATGAQLFELVPGTSAVGDELGRAVALADGKALVASLGAAYLFDVASGAELMELTASDAGANQLFGSSVALSGDVALVGARGVDDAGNNSGALYVFRASTGEELAKVVPSDALPDDGFGRSAALDGTHALVGTFFADDLGGSSGKAYRLEVGDCNANGVLDCEDLANGASEDLNGNGRPDECDWLLSPVNGHWYRDTAPLDWPAAEVQAQAWSGHLATVRSQAENDWLAGSFPNGGEPVWIGYTDQAVEGAFLWIAGDPAGYESWAPTQPDDFLGADWAVLHPATGKWTDEPWLPAHRGIVELVSDDCNGNAIPDVFEVAGDPSLDWNGDGVLDDCDPANYCISTVNSTGDRAAISATGSPVLADDDLTLHGRQLPTHEFGYFLFSDVQGFVPLFGGSSGNLCLGAPIYRFNKPPSGQVLNSGADGTMEFSPSFSVLPQGLVFHPGERWNFQLWFRDFDTGPTSNTTDGIEILFR